MHTFTNFCALALLFSPVIAVIIDEINGNRFLSPYKGQDVSNIEGLVTAKSSSGFYLRSTSPDTDNRSSESICVYDSEAISQVSVGDSISLSGTVSEYRSSSSYVYMTQIISPSKIEVLSSDNEVVPVVIGENGLMPPTEQFSSLDDGDVYSLPNNASQISNENPLLQPSKYGMDFWESLSGELATLTGLRAIAKPNQYGDTWVVGDWPSTGGNERGGLTMTANDSNPEAIIIGSPLDGSKNPTDTKLGDTIDDVTGVITQAYGYYTLLPLTALSVTGSNSTNTAPTELVSDGSCSAISFGSYNVNNLEPDSPTLSKIAEHIATYMKSPTLVFLQEIQDDNGATDNGVTSANKTLSSLTTEIKNHGGANYSFIDIAPTDGKDGGEPGGNIRVAYLYNPSVIQLHNPNPGSSTDGTDVLSGPELTYNPGLIDPSNPAWENSRKPLAAAWETVDGENTFFTINVHLTSKGGSSGIEGDARPPVNGGVEKRTLQAEIISVSHLSLKNKHIMALTSKQNFTNTLLTSTPISNPKLLISGDFNSFSFAHPLQTLVSQSNNSFHGLDDIVSTPATERYTYLYDMNCQQLDHMYVSEGMVGASSEGIKAKMEHLHLNTWVAYDEQASDHDPSVAVLDVCS